MSVTEYMNKFDELRVWWDVQKDSCLTLLWFHTRLKSESKHEVLTHSFDSFDDEFQCALNYEKYLYTSSNKKSTFKPMEYSTTNTNPVTKDINDKIITSVLSKPATKQIIF